MHLVGYTWKYVCDAQTHECQIPIDVSITEKQLNKYIQIDETYFKGD